MDLLSQIAEAERKAEELVKDAQREAREIIKAAEEAGLGARRQAGRDLREETAALLNEAAVSTQDEINALRVRRSSEREAMRALASQKVGMAGEAIFERVVRHGDS